MSKEIKEKCEALYKFIENANAQLTELRLQCKHENTHEGLYSWRIGCIDPAIICSDCGKFIENKSWSNLQNLTHE